MSSSGQTSFSLVRKGSLMPIEIKGDVNAQIFNPALSHVKLTLAPPRRRTLMLKTQIGVISRQ
jgi:hypothetical protein